MFWPPRPPNVNCMFKALDSSPFVRARVRAIARTQIPSRVSATSIPLARARNWARESPCPTLGSNANGSEKERGDGLAVFRAPVIGLCDARSRRKEIPAAATNVSKQTQNKYRRMRPSTATSTPLRHEVGQLKFLLSQRPLVRFVQCLLKGVAQTISRVDINVNTYVGCYPWSARLRSRARRPGTLLQRPGVVLFAERCLEHSFLWQRIHGEAALP